MGNKVTKRWKILAIIAFVLIFSMLVAFLFSGDNFAVLKEIFNTNATKVDIQNAIDKLGIRAYIVVGILAMVQVVFTFIPAEPLHVVSGISFGLVNGIAICLLGIFVGNTIIFILNKIFGDRLKDYFASNVDFDFNSAKASKKIAWIIIILYCLPAIPYGIICFFAASMNIKYPKYIFLTVIGSIPSLLIDVGLGHLTMATSWTISIIVFIAIIILLIVMWKHKKTIFAKLNDHVKKRQTKEANRVGKYNPFINGVLGSLVYRLIKCKIKIRLKSNVNRLEEPCIVLSNHGSFFDFVYAGKLTRRYKPHFVVARMYFHHKLLGKIISGTGAFPKSMFANDIDSTKNCLKVISTNGVLAMMPEARLSTVGRFEDIQDSTYKFIKKMNVAVYTIKINGGYLAKPKWAKKIRKGAYVEAELNPLFSAGQTQNMELEEVQSKVDSALNYNEWDWLETKPNIHYKNKDIAEGLENILCVCPKCKNKYSFSTSNNEIVCDECGLKVAVDDRYQLHGVEFKNIAEWYDWQVDEIRKEIQNNDEYCLESKVELRHLSKDGKSCTRHSGYGICRFTRDGLRYIGTQDGHEIDKIFGIDSIYRVLFGAGEDFEIYENNELYYFVPENKKSAVIWYIVSILLKEKVD